MALVIDGIEIKEVPIKPNTIQFDKDGKKEIFMDASGKVAKKIQVQGSEYKWVYDDGSVCEGKTFKSIKGKPIKPFSKTTVIDTYDICDITELPYFINNELTYLLVSEKFKAKLQELSGKALVFKYVNRGFKVYRAVAYYDEQLSKSLLRCYRGDLRKADLTEHEDVAEISAEADSVESLSLDDLEV
mgnify:CR=1 FL=1|jgi:hypothetical protein|tara:strand:+ start:3101 stop:3661 length:561 start_codon:yes stop_codon:yes gene_type:complete